MQNEKLKIKKTLARNLNTRFSGIWTLSFQLETKCPNSKNQSRGRISRSSGFSLIELMVTITIFVMVTSITLTNYPKFSNKLSLDLLAQDIALSLRQAQIFGSSVLGTKSAGVGEVKKFGAYGLHFEAPNPTRDISESGQYLYTYLLFADISTTQNVKEYAGPRTNEVNPCPGPSLDNECVQKFLITGRNKIKFLCLNFKQGGVGQLLSSQVANPVGACKNTNNQLLQLDVVFVRPNLDAKFTAIGPSGPITGLSNVGIVLESPNGDYYKTIVVWKTGQISVE